MDRLSRRLCALGLLAAAVTVVVVPRQIAETLRGNRNSLRTARAQARGALYMADSNVVLQQSDSDCAAAALKMALSSFGVHREREQLVRELHTARNGTSLFELRLASERAGIPAKSWRLRRSDLATVPLPVIAWIGRNHFVLIRRRLDALTLVVDDPSIGRLVWPVGSFIQVWSGETLVFHPMWVPPAA